MPRSDSTDEMDGFILSMIEEVRSVIWNLPASSGLDQGHHDFLGHAFRRINELREATTPQPMKTAPKDKRILIHCPIYVWNGSSYVERGTHWVECWWVDGKWQAWAGATNARTTTYINPIEWMRKPNE